MISTPCAAAVNGAPRRTANNNDLTFVIIFLVFIIVFFVLDTKKGANHPMLILFSGYRQVTMLHKQARTAHTHKREPSRLLALSCEYWRYSKSRETRAESSIYLKKYGRESHDLYHRFRINKFSEFSFWKGCIPVQRASVVHFVLSVSCSKGF